MNNWKDYNFKIGDRVITTEGETGVIVDICTCDNCKERGFYEPIWESDESGYSSFISAFEAKNGFGRYHKIGEYRFHDLDKSKILDELIECREKVKMLERRLRVITDLQEEELFHDEDDDEDYSDDWTTKACIEMGR